MHGVERDEILSKMPETIDMMAKFFEKKKLKVLPGVKKILARLSKNKEIILGLATGLADKVAKIIIEKAKLAKYFHVMGFGDDTEYRREIIEKCIEQASTPKLVIIGDSIHDVEMAKVFNAKSIAVATGSTSKEMLKDESPDFLFNDLSNTDKVLKAILK
jgi:HAD superfamily hydrolase (TIGR01549 family)